MQANKSLFLASSAKTDMHTNSYPSTVAAAVAANKVFCIVLCDNRQFSCEMVRAIAQNKRWSAGKMLAVSIQHF